MLQNENGVLFPSTLSARLRDEFYFVDRDSDGAERLFFDNSGGALRLRRAVEAKCALEAYPDCPDRPHERALYLREIVEHGTREILSTVFGASEGALITELTASQAMFHMVGMILEHVPGGNVVVSSLEHPSAFDAVCYHAKRYGKEVRVIPADPVSGGILPAAAAELVDEDTCLLSVMAASNVSGYVMDLPAIVQAARAKKPGLYIISDGVQHVPHCSMDVQALALDGANFAPYKFFGVRGCGFAYVSPRVAALPHRKLLGKPQETFALGTATPGNFAAMLAVIDYVREIGRELEGEGTAREEFVRGMHRISLHERALLNILLNGTEKARGLRHIPGINVYADGAPLSRRDLIAAIGVEGMDFSAAATAFKERGVILAERTRDSMYAKRIVEALEMPGALRVSPLHCHNTEDIERFLAVCEEIAVRS